MWFSFLNGDGGDISSMVVITGQGLTPRVSHTAPGSLCFCSITGENPEYKIIQYCILRNMGDLVLTIRLGDRETQALVVQSVFPADQYEETMRSSNIDDLTFRSVKIHRFEIL